MNELPKDESGQPYCRAQMDDLIIFSKDKQSHIRHLKYVFLALIKHQLKISPKKCQVFMKLIQFLGHEIAIIDGRPCIKPMK